jgi:MEMO1 family protein
MTRRPTVAGRFYEGSSKSLKKQLEEYIVEKKEKTKAIGIVSPHAGYVYSGGVAGELFSSIEHSPTYIILCPNHSGAGDIAAIMINEDWDTPLGTAKVNTYFAKKIEEGCDIVTEDSTAHKYEHSLEVQIPFLQYFERDFDFVPICLKSLDYRTCVTFGEQLASVIKLSQMDITIIASSDMNHFDKANVGKEKDFKAIDQILNMNPRGLYETVIKYGISMCGFIPVTVMMIAAMNLGAKQAELVKYAHSGEAFGDNSSVVGYAGIIVK